MKYLLIILILNLILIVTCKNRINTNGSFANELKSLPTYDKTITKQYTGYLRFTDENSIEKSQFFWFVESEKNHSTDPVVVWLNGGPGCSSLLGALTEHGPFTVYKDDNKKGQDKYRVTKNYNSWNLYAHMLYLESPVGVGFSYSNDPSNYTSGDTSTATDNYNAVLQFFSLFPEYQVNDFYVAGESYGGHYVPQLAQEIVNGNSQQNTIINIKGFIAGNPSFNFTTDAQYYLPFMAGHALISINEYENVSQICGNQFYPNSNQQCLEYISQLSENFQLINPYNIYQACKGQGPSQGGGCFTQQLLFSQAKGLSMSDVMSGGQSFIPCLDESAIDGYLNRKDVQESLSVNRTEIPSGIWQPCSSVLNYTQYSENIPQVYQFLIKSGLRVLVFSGDVDSCVPWTSTSQCVQELGLPILQQWRPWLVVDSEKYQQVAGYVITYTVDSQSNTITYATVKGSGHMVATYKPVEALAMFSRFVTNQPF